MPGDYIHTRSRINFETFREFVSALPGRQKWELIDGVPIMMPPARIVHQWIAQSLARRLNDRIKVLQLPWRAYMEIGVHPPADEDWSPQPDVTVIDAQTDVDLVYAQRFYMVAEVLSPNDKRAVLDAKLTYYRAHPHCLAIMFLRQDSMTLTQHGRHAKGWRKCELTGASTLLVLPRLGEIATLAEIYDGVTLAG